MASLQKEGKVRYISVSNVDRAQIERAHRGGHLAAVPTH